MKEENQLSNRQLMGTRMGSACRRWRGLVDKQLQPFGLTDATWLPLLAIHRYRGPFNQKELAEMISIESSTLVRLLDALSQAGIVERQTDGDRRAKIICLTAHGRTVAKKVEAIVNAIRDQVLQEVSEDEIATVMRVMDKISAAMTRVAEMQNSK